MQEDAEFQANLELHSETLPHRRRRRERKEREKGEKEKGTVL